MIGDLMLAYYGVQQWLHAWWLRQRVVRHAAIVPNDWDVHYGRC